MSEKMPHKCCGWAYSAINRRDYPCSKAAMNEHEGKWYCGTHDPVKKAARNKKKQQDWDADWHKRRDMEKRQQDCVSALAGIPDPAKAIAAAREALEKARQDINWMLNNRQFLNDHQFEYLDNASELLAPKN